MKKRLLGRTDLKVSELGLYTRRFGYSAIETASLDLFDAYYELGGRFIQSVGTCPPLASVETEDTRAETLLGAWLRTRSVRREELVLGTRFVFTRPDSGGSIAFSNHIRESLENTLRRLGTHHLDLLICDWNETLVPVEDMLETVSQLIRAGQVRYVVAGAFPSWRVMDSIHRSYQRNLCRFEALQEDYSLRAGTRPEFDSLAMCATRRLGFIARAPRVGGITTRLQSYNPPSLIDEKIADLAHARRTSPARVSLAWTLRNPQVSSALFTATSVTNLPALAAAAEFSLSDHELDRLNSDASARQHPVELAVTRPASTSRLLSYAR